MLPVLSDFHCFFNLQKLSADLHLYSPARLCGPLCGLHVLDLKLDSASTPRPTRGYP